MIDNKLLLVIVDSCDIVLEELILREIENKIDNLIREEIYAKNDKQKRDELDTLKYYRNVIIYNKVVERNSNE